MTSQQYSKAIDTLGLTHAAAAKVLGISERQDYRYAAGDTAVPVPIAKLLRLAIAGKITLAELERA